MIETDFQYQEDGYVVFRDALSAEFVAVLRAEAEAIEHRLLALDQLPTNVELARMPDGQRRISRLEPIRPQADRINEAMTDPAILRLAEQVLGEPVYLLEDKLIYKPPQSQTRFSPHQEWHWTMPLSRKNAMVLVPLDPCNQANGAMKIVPRSHRDGLLPHLEDEISEEHFDRDAAISLDLNPGDVAVVSGGVVHFSGENETSNLPRRLLLLSYNVQSEGDLYARHRARWS